MSTASARLVVGRRIIGFELNPFDDGRGGVAHRPVFTLDNGARVVFFAEETEIGEYGVGPQYIPARRGAP